MRVAKYMHQQDNESSMKDQVQSSQKIAFLSPTFPPDHCGVGDYTAHVCEELVKAGHVLEVWTFQKNPKKSKEFSSHFHFLDRPLGISGFIKFFQELKKFDPQALVIQYTPYLFAPKRGIHLLLPLWILILRVCFRIPILLMTHELHYPVELSPAGVLLGFPQWLQYLCLTFVSTKVAFTYEAPFLRFKKWGKHKYTWIPVGANIQKTAQLLSADISVGQEIPPETRVLLHFGGAHPTNLIHFAFAALEEVLKKMKAKLVFVGIPDKKVQEELLRTQFPHLKPSVSSVGYVTEEEASAWLLRADLVLAPYLDGVSTRRTSFMASLEHEKSVLTTQGYLTNPSIPWEDFSFITATNPRLYAQKALEILENPKFSNKMSEKGAQYYQGNFAWAKIAQAYLDHLKL